MEFYNYSGNIHIHTTHSDGTGSIPEVAEAANAAGLDYIIITDHLCRTGAHEEGSYGRTHVIVGVEFNQAANHYLALGTYLPVNDYAGDPQKTIDEVNQQGGFGFLAHPFEKSSPLVTEGASFPWTDWSVEGYTGLDLWNYSSQWKGEAITRSRIIYWYLFDRDAPVKTGTQPECIQRWDELTQKRPVVAIGGTDNHAIKYKVGPFTAEIFPYEDLFRSINTYVCLPEKMSPDFDAARSQIFDALREGRCFISFDRYPGAGQFYFGAVKGDQKIPMGASEHYSPETFLQVRVPQPGRSLVRLIRNGEVTRVIRPPRTNKNKSKSGNATQLLTFPVTSPGTYRVEINYRRPLRSFRPWIYSNPVYLY